jgi:hypothetical protein
MRSTVTRSPALDRLVAALQRGVCDEAAAQQLYELGPEAVALALLTAARRIGGSVNSCGPSEQPRAVVSSLSHGVLLSLGG